MREATAVGLEGHVESALAARVEACGEFFGAEAGRLARCCHAMAERFARGGRLVALGSSPAAVSDVRHVAVEFVHPVIVGKRALPALGLGPEGGSLPSQVAVIAEEDDIVIGFGAEAADGEVGSALSLASERGCLTIAFAPVGAEWEFEPPGGDAFVRQELVETLYHVLWELVHVFFDHRGLLSGREARPVHDTGASSFLYPFLAESESDLDAVIEDVRASILAKADEVTELRRQTLGEGRGALLAAAAGLRARFERGGKLLACGNGGSATDATDLVADLRSPPRGLSPLSPARAEGGLSPLSPARVEGGLSPLSPRPAIDLTEDPSILTAIANDIGTEEIFQRQVIAYGREGDALIVLSTSGNSANLISALGEARKRGLETIAMVGYDGGRIASEGLADHVVVSRSQHIPRIQEAQASAYHVLRELVELG